MKSQMLSLLFILFVFAAKSQPNMIGKSKQYIIAYQQSQNGTGIYNRAIIKDSTVYLYFNAKDDPTVRMYYILDKDLKCVAYSYGEPVKNIDYTIYTLNHDDISLGNDKWMNNSKSLLITLVKVDSEGYYYLLFTLV